MGVIMQPSREKLTSYPEGYYVRHKGDLYGLYKDGPTPDDGEWLISAPTVMFEEHMRNLLRMFFEEDLVESTYQELLKIFQSQNN